MENKNYEDYYSLYRDLAKTDMEDYEKNRWRRYKPFLSFMNLKKGEKVLEVGCGQGELLKMVQKEKQCVCTGLDLSPDYVVKVKKRGINARLGVAEKLPFEDKTFDHVILDCIMEHVIDTKIVMNEARRVSKGSIFIEVPYREELQPYVYGKGMPHIRSFDDDSIQQTFNVVRNSKTIYVRNIKSSFFRYVFYFILKTKVEKLILFFDNLFLKLGIGEPVFILVESVI